MYFSCTLILQITLACLLISAVRTDECVIGKHDFSLLNGLPWLIKAWNGSIHYDYEISLCKPLSQPCPQDSAVCRYANKRTETVSFGKAADEQISLDANDGGFVLLLKGGATCPGDSNRTLETSINFICEQVLGSPILVDTNDCTLLLEWRTKAACTQVPPSHSEVRCYVYDDNGKKHDLLPLIKQSGAYMVEDGFYINVCREITSDSVTGPCPSTSAACRQHTDVGSPHEGLQWDASNGNLWLRYNSSAAPPTGCGQSASTKITFICPNRDEGRDPVLTSSLECHYEVEWRTEYACAEDHLVSDVCRLSADRHGVPIDLTPLGHHDGGTYHIDVKSSNGHDYRFFMSLCGTLTTPCPTVIPGLTVCKVDMNDTTYGVSLGNVASRTLRYSDRELTMIYEDSQTCANEFHRKTIIMFHCNQTIDIGQPGYRSDDNCTYIFDWHTKHACLPQWRKCRVDAGKKRFDLSSLVRHSTDTNWEALTDVATGASKSRYFINVCDDVVKIDEAKDCPDGAAICLSTDSKYRSLGKFTTSPTYIAATGDVILHYMDGDKCGEGDGKKIESIITLKCKPGDLQSGPSLVHRSVDGCSYEFEWPTAAACVLSRQTGNGCKVTDDDAGYSFDLSSLTQHGDKAYYVTQDNTTAHDYYINVCAKVTGTNCSAKSSDAAICQLDNNDIMNVFNAGQPSDVLTYFDGVITLTYSDGDMYHSHVPRRSEIAFVCDRRAGVGQPHFQIEANHTYSFDWPTALACPVAAVQCAVTDGVTGVQYDISSLSHSALEGNWFAMDTVGNEKRKFYLNVCRPLSQVTVVNGCSSSAGICLTQFNNDKEEVLVENLGEALKSPTIAANGDLVLTFINGSSCKEADGKVTSYKSTVTLHCQAGAMSTGPEFIQKVGNCVYSFMWNTAAACPSEHTVTSVSDEPCSVKDANSGYVYNMHPLTRTGDADFYEVADAATSKKFKVNICGMVSACGGAVCDGDKVLGKLSTKLSVTSEGVLSLTYEAGQRDGDGNLPHAILTFECDRSADIDASRITFKQLDAGATYMFTVSTALACEPAQLDCIVTDHEGVRYDLSRLGRDGTNWVADDTRTEHSDLHYYINVCRPVNAIEKVTLPGKAAVGAYQISDRGDVRVAGHIVSQPHASTNGTVTLRYVNGDRCHKGKPHDSHRSTRIIFFCDNVEHGPVFQDESSGCEYLFLWRTPVVCSVKPIIGDKCSVVEPLYGTTFDLSALQKTGTVDWVVTSGNDQYLVNICGALNSGTGVCSGSTGACQKIGDLLVNIGDSNSQLSYHDGELSLLYTHGTGSCMGAYESATKINFLCDSTANNTTVHYVAQSTAACVHLFEWTTPLACPLVKRVECAIDDGNGSRYDLSMLRLTSDNYEVVDGMNEGKKYVINVCAPLVHRKGVTCPPNSAACLIDENEKDPTKRFTSTGRIGDHVLSIENNYLKLEYDSGAPCQLEGATATWKTRDIHMSERRDSYMFSLNSLKKADGYTMQMANQRSLVINICAPLDSATCGGKSGACLLDKSADSKNTQTTVGDFNSQLTFTEGLLTLRYRSDEPCKAGTGDGAKRSTVVNFVCNADETGSGRPELVGDSDDCIYYVYWHTSLACEEQVKCSVELSGGQLVDLSALIKRVGYHTALDGTSDTSSAYYVNVCRPLSPIHGTMCPPQAAICKLTPGKEPQSLGKVVNGPFVDKSTGDVIIVYEHGMKCRDTYVASKIVFSCERGLSMGVPRLVLVEYGCVYVFEWKTYVVCPGATAPVTKTDCQFTDASTGHVFDFKPLKRADGYQVSTAMGKLSLSICDAVDDCPHSSSCLRGTDDKQSSYGVAGSETFIREGDKIKMSYSDGDACPSGSPSSTYILFICDDSVIGTGQPTLFTDITQCEVVLQWRTPFACMPSMPDCDIAHAGHTFDLSPLTLTAGSYSLKDGDDEYLLNICGGVQTDGCPSTAIACRQLHDGSKHVLGLVATQKLSVMDDGETIVAEYNEGSTACGQRRRRSDNPTASVRIIFRCGTDVGSPILLHRQENQDKCVFEFEWVTKVACAESRVSVHPDKGVFTDPLTGKHVDITSLLNAGNVKTANEAYMLNLNGISDVSGCQSSAVCQLTGVNHASIADINSKTYYMEDGVLQVVFLSSATCGTNTKTVWTKLNIRCMNTNDSRPTLVYKSSDGCQFLFEWPSVDVCLGGVDSGGSSFTIKHAHHTMAIVSIVTVCLLTAITIFILRKPARRKALTSKLRALRTVAANGSVRYSKLFSSTENGTSSAGYRLLGSNTSTSNYTSFDEGDNHFLNDDSDEDMLL